ncbi:accessory Sec system S-layer assembly protein [Bacillus sp. CGMCC 1.16607]|uniref:accessory Sec system S-layer assembly protein n=1 Tax=Bacillus sp. CGMCC 1.16607 TaxID=3351842 RepID=UPI00363FFFA6
MLSFFKKKNKSGKDSTISSKELLKDVTELQDESEITTELSIHPSLDIPQEQQYVLRFLNNDLPPLKPNQISLAGIELHQTGDAVIVSAFVRNSLLQAVRLNQTHLLLIGPNDEKLARKAFDLSELGELPARSSRPWNFTFEKSTLLTEEIPKEGWKLAFELKTKHRLDLAESWEKSLSPEDKEKLTTMVEKIDPPKEGEVNFLGLQAKITEQKELHVTMLIRNGSDKNIKLEQLPLLVEDATGDAIAKGGFKLEDFEVKANTSKPWTFIFPESLLLKESPDLSRWKASAIQG